MFRSDFGSGLSLRAETAWLRAHGRLWRFVVRARPFARIASARGLSVATPAALPRSRRRRLLPSLRPIAFAPLPRLRAARSRSTREVTLRRRWGCRCSLSLHRSRICSEQSLSPVGCLIVAPAPAGGRRRERLRPSAPQGNCSLRCAPPCATVLIVGIPPGRPIFGSARVGVRVARPATDAPSLGRSLAHHSHEYD